MQAFLSRAAQTRSACRCRSCTPSTTITARRSTTAASRRQVKFSDVFTACYTTILGTAAIVDAQKKDERRKEWDIAIAEAKADLAEEPKPRGLVEIKPSSTTRYEKYDLLSAALEAYGEQKDCGKNIVFGCNQTSGIPTTPLGNKLSQIYTQLKEDSEISAQEKVEPGFSVPSDADLDNDWFEEQADTDLPAREPKSPLHLKNLEDAMARLVGRFLEQSTIFSRNDNINTSENQGTALQIQQMVRRLENLETSFTNLPSYSWNDTNLVAEQRSLLHKTLVTVFNKATPRPLDMDLLLAKICYNLLVSTTPHSIATYNILIREFTRLKRPDLAQIVVDSFHRETKFKPTKETGKLIVDHYIAKNDPVGLRMTRRQMAATKGDMRIGCKHVNLLERDRRALQWATTQDVSLPRQGYIIRERMPLDANILHSLIQGCVKMESVRSAIRYVRITLRKGYQIQSNLLCKVIKACVEELDLKAGFYLLRAIVQVWNNGEVSQEIVFSRKVRWHIHRLLRFCGLNLSQDTIPYLCMDIPAEAIKGIIRHMHLESIKDKIQDAANRLESLSKILNLNHNSLQLRTSSAPIGYSQTRPNLDAVESALDFLKEESLRDLQRYENLRTNEIESRSLRVAVLEFQVAYQERFISHKEEMLMGIIYRRLSKSQQAAYAYAIDALNGTNRSLSPSEEFDLVLTIWKCDDWEDSGNRLQTLGRVLDKFSSLEESFGTKQTTIESILQSPSISMGPLSTDQGTLKCKNPLDKYFPRNKKRFSVNTVYRSINLPSVEENRSAVAVAAGGG